MTRHRQQPVLRTARAFWPILIGLIAVGVIMAVSTYRGGLDRAAWDPADRWQGDANSALARAQEADLPVLMVFSQPGCPPCIRLKKDMLMKAGIYEQTDRGDCFHIKIKLAGYPKNKQTAIDALREVYKKYGMEDAV
jgi:thioredoxin-related protein